MSLLSSGPPHASAFWPIIALLIYVSFTVFLIVKVLVNISVHAQRLRPSLSAAPVTTRRAYLIALCALFSLACTSLVVTCRAVSRHAELSYTAWAVRYGVPQSKSFWVEVGSCFLRRFSDKGTWSSGGVYLGLWVGDSDVRNEFWACILRSGAWFWWTAIWSFAGFVWVWDAGFRARKHSIAPFLPLAALSQLVSVSFAQSLFLIHLLLIALPQRTSSKGTDAESSIPLMPRDEAPEHDAIETLEHMSRPHSSPRPPLTLSHLRTILLFLLFISITSILLPHSHSPMLSFYTTLLRILTVLIPYFIVSRPAFYIDIRMYTSPKIRLALLGTLVVVAFAIPFKGGAMTIPALRREIRVRPALGVVGWDLGLMLVNYVLWDVWELVEVR